MSVKNQGLNEKLSELYMNPRRIATLQMRNTFLGDNSLMIPGTDRVQSDIHRS